LLHPMFFPMFYLGRIDDKAKKVYSFYILTAEQAHNKCKKI